jgi:minichromosome maintenance protein 10
MLQFMWFGIRVRCVLGCCEAFQRGLLPPCALMMEAVNNTETSVNIYETALCNILECSHLHSCYSFSRRKNGGRCTVFVNKNRCEFCVYHLKQEYQKCSKRTELNSLGGSGLINIRNKVLGKNEVSISVKMFSFK